MTHKMKKIKTLLPGVLVCLLIAVPSWFLGKIIPIIGAPVFGIIFGMILSKNSFKFKAGIKYTSKKLLQYSIILLGFEMNLYNVIKVGSQSLYVIVFTISISFLTAYFVGRALKLHGKMTILIGVGTSICGGSAIAATAPVIQAEDEDVAHAISTIFLFNIIAVFIFPALGRAMGMSDIGFGMWAGTAINDTSSVVAAGASWSAAAGNNTALAFATIVKLTRTLMIVPITLALALYTAKNNKNTDSGTTFKFSKVFPWFVLGFVFVAIINTFAGIPATISHFLVETGKFMITMAMAAIGLNTNLIKLVKNGFKPIFLGLCCWLAVALTSIIVQLVMKTW
jgi:uncharacterized integral membrane protein (TIGR00698 family)